VLKFICSAGALIVSIAVVSSVIAHPGHSGQGHPAAASIPVRTWTILKTGYQQLGTFVAEKDGQVQIRLQDDSLARLTLSELVEGDQQWVSKRLAEIRRANFLREIVVREATVSFDELADDVVEDAKSMENRIMANKTPLLLAQLDAAENQMVRQLIPEMAKAFEAFVKTKAIRTRWDENYFYVESKGIPDHQMMVGITSWQQQVPLPQLYAGENAWRIPLHPVPAKNPLSTKNRFLRGAIALAVNGVPIFNPLNNRGDDAFLFGELDEFGGHCGRADDYHYHIAPVHLEKTVGKGLPIAYALDGYPIYGYEEPNGEKVQGLDAFNGHVDGQGHYHYHATKKYPYLNGGFHGEIVERGDQVDPQPRAEPIRPDLRPLREAKIVDFVETKPHHYRLTYEVRGKKGSVSYTLAENGSATFTFVDPGGSTKTETYTPRRRGSVGDNGRRPPRRDDPPSRHDRQPPDDVPRTPREPEQARFPSRTTGRQLEVTSAALDDNGFISSEYTCDGASSSPPLNWNGAPPETKSFAISLWHTAPDQEKSYWVVYNIPAAVTSIEKNARKAGRLGINDKRKTAYDPMCSKGPGIKTYHITVFALSAELDLAPEQASRAALLKAIKDLKLAEGTLDFQYERKR
jgi:Raf kinase inhibitor-like YbhB/YbcL family protein